MAYADIAAGVSQEVLCLVPWNVTLVNEGHECVVVEASSPADPLSPQPADPDVLDAPTYRQTAQRNLSVTIAMGGMHSQVIIRVKAGPRYAKTAKAEVRAGGELSKEGLESLGLRVSRSIEANRISAILSDHSLSGSPNREPRESLRLHVPRGTSAPVYLNVAARESLALEEYGLVRVVERDHARAIGGLSIVLVAAEGQKGEAP